MAIGEQSGNPEIHRREPIRGADSPSSHINQAPGVPVMVRHGRNATNGAQRLATGLGWLSLGLGVAGLFATSGLIRSVGVRDRSRVRAVVRAVAVRELVSGVGLLARRRRAGFAWSRVLGDVMDIALLQRALSSDRSDGKRGSVATLALLGVAAVDSVAAVALSRDHQDEPSRGIRLLTTITIRREPEDIYRFWRELQNLPRFMSHLESVEVRGDTSRWRARLPAHLTLEWESELIEEIPNERISWRSLPGSQVENHGSVRFQRAPGGRGTEVHVALTYEPPAGALGGAFSKLFGAIPQELIRADLQRLKQILETGDVARSDASIHRGPHPARPSDERIEATRLGTKKDGE